MNYVRRFVFVHYEDLLEVRFRQLEKVTDKLYVFVPSDVAQVPFWLVRQVQAMGRDLAWIDLGLVSYEESKLLMAFRIGTLHEQADPGVEFAILSEAPELDALVGHLQQSGRQCLRIKPKPRPGAESGPGGAKAADAFRQNTTASSGQAPQDDIEDLDEEVDLSDLTAYLNDGGYGEPRDADDYDEAPDTGDAPERESRSTPFGKTPDAGVSAAIVELVDARPDASAGSGRRERRHHARVRPETNGTPREPLRPQRPEAEVIAEVTPLADDVIRKLIRSGNRPKDLSMLRSYILLHSDEARTGHLVDDVIRLMRRKGEIELDGSVVKYTF